MIRKIYVWLTFWMSLWSINAYSQVMMNTKDAGNVIAFASDTQAPQWIESLFLKEKNNKKATALVFDDIIRQRPQALFIMGDVVSLGYSERAWMAVDTYLKETRKEGIPVYATLGNHELMGRPVKGEANFQKRFPGYLRTGYMQIVDSVAVLMLNSNFGSLSKAETAQQQKWLNDTLQALDKDPAIRAVIVGCHHPPYTNSRLVKSSSAVQEQFVKPYLSSKKCKLFITGHSHAFEYFKMEGKDFLIIGGGGGLNHPLNTGKNCLNDQSCDYKPMFHYLTVNVRSNELHVVSHQLRDDFTGFEEGFSIKIPL